jgi:hypothetical protein
VAVWINEAYERFDNQPQDPAIYLQLVSTSAFPCYNYYFPTSSTISATVRVEVGEPVRPNLCLTAVGPARSRVRLPIGEGVFSLELVTWLGTDLYQLTVLPDKVELTPVATSVTKPAFTRVYRYPRDSLVFYCSGPDCYRVLDDLESGVPLNEIIFPGDGLSPYPPAGRPIQRNFTYVGDPGWQAVNEWAANESSAGLCALFGLTNWKSEAFTSWVATSPTPTPTHTSAPTACNLSATPAPTLSPTASPTSMAQVIVTPAALPVAGGRQVEGDGSIWRWIMIVGAAGGVSLIAGSVRRRRA